MSTLSRELQQPINTPTRRNRVAAPRATHQPAVTVPNGPIEAPRAHWRVILGAIVATLREWRRRTVARRELASFDERMLRDIGIDPSIVDYEMRRSFWHRLRDWRD